MPSLESGEVRIHYEIAGEGPPVLLHTGGAGDSEMWRLGGFVDRLAGFSCILLDQRGHGRSGRPAALEQHHMDRYVGDVLALLEHLGLERTAFFGYSDGARVGYSFGAAHPGRLNCLVALGAPGGKAGNREWRAMAQKYRRLGMAGLVTQIEAKEGIRLPGWLNAQFLQTDVEMFAVSHEARADWEGPWALAPRIRAPVLILAGELEDPDRQAAGLAAGIPRGRSAILPGMGHVGAFLRPDLVLEYARPFLDNNAGNERVLEDDRARRGSPRS